MPQALTAAQRDELKALLLAHRSELLAQIAQKRENLTPPSADEGGVVQRNVAREVEQVLTDIETADIQRIDHALKTIEDGSYGLCAECGCHIPFERLKIEPQTQHCVACKSRWEQQHHKAH
ncbi:MAG: TraR/DksA C4-type zinc finger protein [Burkholderiaceae bacterium]|nr:TraR/DksA C4-type zinc finger protein [Burkholderiaceae bacterium]